MKIILFEYFKESKYYDLAQKVVIFTFGKRVKLAKKYIKGSGLEIGALNYPLKISSSKAKVTYIDRLSNHSLRKQYPELKQKNFVKVGIIDNGEKLKKIKSNSQDFVIANHFIEHCEDPISTFINHLRVLKKDGIIYWAVPNKERTFDKKRKITTLNHLWLDYKEGPMISRTKHYNEWVKYVLNVSDRDIEKKVNKLMKDKYSIHYHVWNPQDFRSFLHFIKKKLKLKFKIEEFVVNLNEFIVVIRKNNYS